MSAAYRHLLRTYPLQWREQHGAVVTALQQEADADRGRSGPSLLDRLGFLARGVLQHGRRARVPAPPLASFVDAPRLFDQSNGLVPEGTDALDRRGRRIDRRRVHGGLDRIGNVVEAPMEPQGWGRS